MLQIQSHFNNTDPKKQQYLRHIQTANNSDFYNIKISPGLELETFFKTLSLVFDISITSHEITRNNPTKKHTTTTINSANTLNQQKVLNIRQSPTGTAIYEPWINPILIDNEQEVCQESMANVECSNAGVGTCAVGESRLRGERYSAGEHSSSRRRSRG